MRKLGPAFLLIGTLALASCSATPEVAPQSPTLGEAPSQQQLDASIVSEPDVVVSAMWAFDVTNIEEIREHADLIVTAEVTKIADRASFTIPGSGMPYTKVSLRVTDVLKGPAIESDFTALYPGGTVTLQQVLDDSPKESAEKSGLTSLSTDELREQTQTYAYDEQTRLVPGSTYVLALGRSEDGTYTIGPAGFAVFLVQGETIVNDVTGDKYTPADLRE